MPCFKPLQGYYKLGGGLTFKHEQSNGIKLSVPCGQCIGCRLERKTEWGLRLSHEAAMHFHSCFITLTYNPESLPTGETLVKRHVQLFMKNLRQHLDYHHGKQKKVRYFACGEYGEQKGRPHYHIILFGWEPTDGEIYSNTEKGKLYISKTLERLWGRGYAAYGSVTEESCLYVAGYTVQKITGEMAKEHYTRVLASGEILEIQPEFALMSTRPGIGAGYYSRFERDFRDAGDFALMHGKKKPVPRYYDKLYERKELHRLESIKNIRRQKAKLHRANNTPERLAVRETVCRAKLKFNQERKANQ